MAQVVWTVTQFPQVDRVCFSLDGVFVEVPTDSGLSDESVSRADYVSVAPPPAEEGSATRERPTESHAPRRMSPRRRPLPSLAAGSRTPPPSDVRRDTDAHRSPPRTDPARAP